MDLLGPFRMVRALLFCRTQKSPNVTLQIPHLSHTQFPKVQSLLGFQMSQAKIIHYSDVLCIWAYVGEQAVYCLDEDFGGCINIEPHYCSVFPDTQAKITTLWAERGGFEGYASHVQNVAAQFEGVKIHRDVWSKTRPRSSASPHLFLKAIDLLQVETEQNASPFALRPSAKAAKALRQAFFAEAQDIANWSVQKQICKDIDISFDAALNKIETGEAIAKLAADYEQARNQGIQGSPTFVLNEGRQKLFGNIGYSILSANIKELITGGPIESTSLCS